MTSSVRAARSDDLHRLPDIEIAAGVPFRAIGMPEIADDAPPGAEWYEQRLAAGLLWVVEISGATSGYLAGSMVDGDAHVAQVSVDPRRRGLGLGAALVGQLATWARGEGIERMTLTTFAEVPWNGPYYARIGWHRLEALGPELTALRDQERRDGLDRWPRLAMERDTAPLESDRLRPNS